MCGLILVPSQVWAFSERFEGDYFVHPSAYSNHPISSKTISRDDVCMPKGVVSNLIHKSSRRCNPSSVRRLRLRHIIHSERSHVGHKNRLHDLEEGEDGVATEATSRSAVRNWNMFSPGESAPTNS